MEDDVEVYRPDTRSGRIYLTCERPGHTEVYVLLPPTLGTLRQLYEVGDQIERAQVEAGTAKKDELEAATPTDEDTARLLYVLKMIGADWIFNDVGVEGNLKWWAKAIDLCEADGKKADPEDLPSWLGAANLYMNALTHWLQFPTLARGISAPRADMEALLNGGR